MLCYQFYLPLKLVIRWNKIIIKNHFAEASCRFADVIYHFAGENWEKPILHWHFLQAQVTIFLTQIEKNLFRVGIFLSRQKNLNYKGYLGVKLHF